MWAGIGGQQPDGHSVYVVVHEDDLATETAMVKMARAKNLVDGAMLCALLERGCEWVVAV